jgi:hydrogenase maturation protease
VRILIVGVGNVLHGDDGFGVETARRLAQRTLPEGVDLIETGIGGIALVQELQTGYDALVVIDAVDRGRPAGTVLVIEPDVIDVELMTPMQRHDMLADMHLATPERALMVANALGVLPARRFLVGCQPFEIEVLRVGLSPIVAAAVDVAVAEVERCVADLLMGS